MNNTSRLLVTSVASLLLMLRAFAITDTWDGGGPNDILTTAQNWADDTAPASDLANTDLIFAGAIRPAPTLAAPFSANSITYDNTAAGFTIQGDPFNVGSGGITNNDTQTMSFANVVNFDGVVASSVTAASGGLTFGNGTVLPTGFLIVDGAGATSFQDIAGPSTAALGKFGAGTMTWNPGGPVAFDIAVQEGTLTIGGDGTVNILTSTASIDVTGTSVLNVNDNLALNGAQLTRTGNAGINLAAGRTLNVLNSADVDITGSFGVNGSTILVADAGSTFGADGFTVSGGGFLSVSAGADVSVPAAFLLGAVGNGTAVVDGIGSSLGGGGHLFMGQNPGNVASLTFSNGSTGTFGAMDLAFTNFPLTTATLRIQSGAAVTGTTLNAADLNSQATAEITITGTGSSLTLTGQAMFGGASGSIATLTVENGGIFTTGTGTTTVNATGDLNINAGGTMIVRGDMTIASSLDIANGGTVILGGGAPAPGEFAEADLTGPDGFDFGAVENIGGASTADFVAVPEPGSATLIASGALSLLARRRRR